jgi:hypothetical protein
MRQQPCRQRYGTAFGGTPVDSISKVLVSHGYHYQGKDLLYANDAAADGNAKAMRRLR